MSRFIGIAHRVKVRVLKDKPPESRPTKIAIRVDGKVAEYELATETDELDFLLGRFPTKHRGILPEDDPTQFLPHQVVWRSAKKGEDTKALPRNWLRRDKTTKQVEVAVKVPVKFDGLRSGDKVALVLSGSGNRLAYAASRIGEQINAEVYHLPGFKLRERRPEADKDKPDTDHLILAAALESEVVEFYRMEPRGDREVVGFYRMEPRDRDLVALREAYNARVEAMKARMAATQRLHAHFIGQMFCNPEGRYPEGELELAYEAAVASDAVLQALIVEERRRNKEMDKAAERLAVYRELFAPIKGVGPAIASRLICAIGDIRQFSTDAKLKAFCGVHVLADGRFPRRRNGELANWKPDCRQALYLLGDQFNRRPDSVWGKKLREYKIKLRTAHPEVVIGENGKKKYTDAHIHKMAIWRTLTKFVERLWKEWWALENEFQRKAA